ncbi:MAG: hypothetical protein COV76_06055 [Candidatus Omnitrophica bacterium CG11_big_fil_rev_8_21_14_0_20_64_10]|nr:MAG: hypothetical protein COV76_06055 [Candidatus Omnitrophica bacterium CG11_big_fil_rev_8_21_14_0_20_64_10]
MRYTPEDTLAFVVKTITDLGKAIIAVGFASYFFERLALGWRVGFGILGILLIIAGFIIYPRTGGDT